MLLSCSKHDSKSTQLQPTQQDVRQQVVKDSIAVDQARHDAQLAMLREQKKLDKTDSLSKAPKEATKITASVASQVNSTSDTGAVTDSGNFALQVSSWHTMQKANSVLEQWKNRGYVDAYIIKSVHGKNGHVWYGVRLGNFPNNSVAEQTGKKIANKFNTNYWVAYSADDSSQDIAQNSSSNTAISNATDSSNIFISSGNYSLQISSWQSKWKAQKELEKWKKRGFNYAYITKSSSSKIGYIWYRVRLGHLPDYSTAKKTGKEIASKYNVNYWISYAG